MFARGPKEKGTLWPRLVSESLVTSSRMLGRHGTCSGPSPLEPAGDMTYRSNVPTCLIGGLTSGQDTGARGKLVHVVVVLRAVPISHVHLSRQAEVYSLGPSRVASPPSLLYLHTHKHVILQRRNPDNSFLLVLHGTHGCWGLRM